MGNFEHRYQEYKCFGNGVCDDDFDPGRNGPDQSPLPIGRKDDGYSSGGDIEVLPADSAGGGDKEGDEDGIEGEVGGDVEGMREGVEMKEGLKWGEDIFGDRVVEVPWTLVQSPEEDADDEGEIPN